MIRIPYQEGTWRGRFGNKINKAYYKTKLNVLEYSGKFWNVLEYSGIWDKKEVNLDMVLAWTEFGRPLELVRKCSGIFWKVLECSRMLRKVLWVGGGWYLAIIVSSQVQTFWIWNLNLNWRGPLRHLEMTWNWSGPELDNIEKLDENVKEKNFKVCKFCD